MHSPSSLIVFALSLAASALALPHLERRNFQRQNGFDAIGLNAKFATLNANSPCQNGENACVNNGFAQCVGGKFVIQPCAGGTVCAALPLVNSPGTSIACTTAADRDARIAATGASGGGGNNGGGNNGGQNNGGGNNGGQNNGGGNNGGQNNGGGNNGGQNNGGGNNGDPQQSLTLDPAVIAQGFKNDGQAVPAAGQVPSLTSSNNFINFCKTIPLPITDGKQIAEGSCNPAPMGVIPSKSKMPASKFVFPANQGRVAKNAPFTIKMAIQNLETGHFTNAQQNYFSAPQQLNNQGIIKGHSHVVVQQIESMKSTKIADPTVFAFFKGLNGAAKDGILETEVTDGLPAGIYRLCSINTSSNHAPAIVPVAQHGALDDCVYFTVE